jgi:diguanylate cyclase (GGDEF)-like protein
MNKGIATLFSLLLIILIGVAGYSALGNLVSSQTQQHQQSVSPIFGLIESELVEPLHIATTLDKIGVYNEYFIEEEPNSEKLVTQLNEYTEHFDLAFYVAHEKSRKQYNSDGRVFDLIEGEVLWYFTLKDETDYEVQAVLGNREDVHLYIDVRQYDDAGEFIGFVGVGKSLDKFISSFQKFKNDYGHEFIFVNNRDEIVLSSMVNLLPTNSIAYDEPIGITTISDLPWYDKFEAQTLDQIEPSLVLPSEKGDVLISKLSFESLNWSIYLLTPLSDRQNAVNKSFAIYIGIGILVLLVLYKVLFSVVDYYADKLSRSYNIDPLTKLVNRRYAGLYFSRKRKQHRPTALLMIGLDDFKNVREQHGYIAGDLILQKLAKQLLTVVGEKGLVARWGGDKFVVLLPNMEQEEAVELAEECREIILKNQINVSSPLVHTTASIGVSYSRDLSDTFALMLEWAEQAMKRAKRKGKNKVVLRKTS